MSSTTCPPSGRCLSAASAALANAQFAPSAYCSTVSSGTPGALSSATASWNWGCSLSSRGWAELCVVGENTLSSSCRRALSGSPAAVSAGGASVGTGLAGVCAVDVSPASINLRHATAQLVLGLRCIAPRPRLPFLTQGRTRRSHHPEQRQSQCDDNQIIQRISPKACLRARLSEFRSAVSTAQGAIARRICAVSFASTNGAIRLRPIAPTILPLHAAGSSFAPAAGGGGRRWRTGICGCRRR